MIEKHVTQTTPHNDIDNLKYEKNQYELLLSQLVYFFRFFLQEEPR